MKNNRPLIRTLTMLLLAALILPAIAAASDSGDPPALGTEADAQVLRGTFVQHKHLAQLEHALVSSGHYVVARGRGLLWQVEKPVHSTLVITPKALTERSNGQQTAHISARQQPALGAVASILLAVFQGNTGQLSRYFDIHRASDDAAEDKLTLTPRTDAVRRFIKRLTIRGGDTIRHIRIDQPGGDYNVIDLEPSHDSSNTLTADERRAFSH